MATATYVYLNKVDMSGHLWYVTCSHALASIANPDLGPGIGIRKTELCGMFLSREPGDEASFLLSLNLIKEAIHELGVACWWRPVLHARMPTKVMGRKTGGISNGLEIANHKLSDTEAQKFTRGACFVETFPETNVIPRHSL